MAKIKHHIKNRLEKPYGLEPKVFEFNTVPVDTDYDKYMVAIGKRNKKLESRKLDQTLGLPSTHDLKRMSSGQSPSGGLASHNSINRTASNTYQHIHNSTDGQDFVMRTEAEMKKDKHQIAMNLLASRHTNEDNTSLRETKRRGDKTYLTVAQRQLADGLDEHELKDLEIKKYGQLLDRLYRKPLAHKEILKGIFTDSKQIAKSIEANRLLNRFFDETGVQEDRKLRIQGNSGKRMPVKTDPEDFEETVEEKQKNTKEFTKQLQMLERMQNNTTNLSTDQEQQIDDELTLQQVMKQYAKKEEHFGPGISKTEKRKQDHDMKDTYPMCISYFKPTKKTENEPEPIDLVTFALVSKEIKMMQIKHTGTKKSFDKIASVMVDGMPTDMDVRQHKVTNKLLIIIAMQGISQKVLQKNNNRDQETSNVDPNDKAYVSVIQIDQCNDYKPTRLHLIEAAAPQITRVLYRQNCGLVMGCFRGYIEVFDSDSFMSKFKWDNDMKSVSMKNKQKEKDEDRKRTNTKQFEKQLTIDMQTSDILSGLDNEMQEVSIEPDDIESPNTKPAFQIGNKAQKKKLDQVTINCLDYSAELDLIAFGTVHGKVCVLDSSTMSFVGAYEAHPTEVQLLYFYEKQLQMLTLSNEGEVCLWDAQKMVILQSVKSKQYTKVNQISTACFSPEQGSLLIGTSKVYKWLLKDDTNTRIQIDQQHTVARDFLTQFSASLRKDGIINQDGEDQNKPIVKFNFDEEKSTQETSEQGEDDFTSLKVSEQDLESEEILTPEVALKKRKAEFQSRISKEEVKAVQVPAQQLVNSIFNYQNLASANNRENNESSGQKISDYGSNNVLACKESKLAGCFFNTSTHQLFTIDENCLIRLWDLKQGICVRSYPLEVPKAKSGPVFSDNNLDHFKTSLKISCIRLSSDNRHFVVAFEGGIVQINNAYSGTILYNKAEENKIELEQEVANLQFFSKQTNFWVAATLWDGKIAFLNRPGSMTGPEVMEYRKQQSSSKRDVTCLDISTNNHMVTASMDNMIIYWNSYNGREAKKIYVPEDMASLKDGNTIQMIKFAAIDSDEFLLVFISNGEIFILEKQTESFITPSYYYAERSHEKSFGAIPKFSIIDKTDNMILAVSESGKGSLHTIDIVVSGSPRQNKRQTSQRVLKTVKITLHQHFKVHSNSKLGTSKAVMSVSLQPKLGFFMVASRNGSISFYNIKDCSFQAYLNQEQWNTGFGQKITNYKKIGTCLTMKISDQESEFLNSMKLKMIQRKLSATSRKEHKQQEDSQSVFAPSYHMKSIQLTTGDRNQNQEQFSTVPVTKAPKELIESYDTAKIGAMLSTMARSSGQASTPRQ